MKVSLLFGLFALVAIVQGRIQQPKIWASPSVLERSGDAVTISFDGFSPNSEDIIAIYSPASTVSDVNSYIGWKNLTDSISSTELQFTLVNNRADFVFRLLIRRDNTTIASATSNIVSFKNKNEPLQAHLALTDDPSQMTLMWVTDESASPVVYYGLQPDQLEYKALASSATYTRSDMCAEPATSLEFFRSPGTIHTALMVGLRPSTTYYYKYGSDVSGYAESSFKTSPPQMTEDTVHLVIYGDLGVDVPFSIHQEEQVPSVKTVKQIVRLMNETSDAPTLAVHIGDISYARGYAYIWEYFFSLIQPIATRVPYMVGIGNHEYDHQGQPFDPNWANYGNDSGGECGVPYQSRFAMPGPKGNLWYSFNYGPIHFLMMSTEHDFLPGSQQFQFLETDLKNVDRNVTPWLIFMGHRPMYSSSAGWIADGILNHLRLNLEPLLLQYKVDLCFWGHVHKYERTCGVNNMVCADRDEEAPVHIVVGNAGNDYQVGWEEEDHGHAIQPDWSIFRTAQYGFGKMSVNRDRLEFNLIGDQRGDVHDVLVLNKKK